MTRCKVVPLPFLLCDKNLKKKKKAMIKLEIEILEA